MRYTEWMDACVESIVPGSATSFVYAGRGVKEIEDYLNQKNILKRGHFVNKGFLSHEETLKLQFEADALLLFGWDDPQMGGSLQTKFYEYMAAGKPIILFGGNRNDECFEILNRIGGFISIETKDEAVKFLKNPWNFLTNGKCSEEKRSEFSYSAQAINLDSELTAHVSAGQ
jgi:glycosyltransferase involved in cell wall biosynthesis